MAERRRTEIAKIADSAARLVTYSQRRKGLFDKVSEFCLLCDTSAAVVVFSPAGKPCSFGDPSAEEIISDYLPRRRCLLPHRQALDPKDNGFDPDEFLNLFEYCIVNGEV